MAKKKTGKAPAKAKKKPTATKAVAKKPTRKSAAKPKAVKQPVVVAVEPPKKRLRLRKPLKHPARLPSAIQLTRTTANIFWAHKGLFIGIAAVYGVLNLVLAQGLSSGTDVAALKQELTQALTGNVGAVVSSAGVFVTLVGSAGNSSNQAAGTYQLFLGLIGSLAVIWALRQVRLGSKLRIRDAYYRGMSPLIPFILVVLIAVVQLIPMLLGSLLYSLVVGNGIAVHVYEKIFWVLLFGGLTLTTLYMLTATLFAMYIVTLPDMTPMKALRSARDLVRHRRWTVLRKILFLPLLLLIAAAVIMLPVIIFITPLTQVIFFVLTTLSLVATHSYMYTLYRELLSE